MEMNEYQETAGGFCREFGKFKDPRREHLLAAALGLGETGEVQDLVKKHVYHDHPIPDMQIIKELGDILWYVADMSKLLGYTLDQVATLNLEKLQRRYPSGKFSSEESINRVENPPTGGTFRLTSGGKISDPIPYNATPREWRKAVDSLHTDPPVQSIWPKMQIDGGPYEESTDCDEGK